MSIDLNNAKGQHKERSGGQQVDEWPRVESALQVIDADDRETWVRTGQAIQDEFGEAGFPLWDDWSRTGDNYSEQAARDVWRSFDQGGGVTIASLFRLARENGWTDSTQAPRLTPGQAEARRRSKEEARRLNAEEKTRTQAEASKAALAIYNQADASSAAGHPYAVRKRLDFGSLVRRGEYLGHDCLIVPMYGQDKQIWSVQAIHGGPLFPGERDKTFLAGGKKKGCFFPVGPTFIGASRVCIAEGLATGAAVHDATGLPVVVAFDAGNLLSVGEVVRRLAAPGAEIVFCADDDQKPGTDKNPGIEAARKAAEAIGGKLAVPDMGKKADFWDLWNEQRPDAVRKFINAACQVKVEKAACLSGIINGADLMALDIPEITWAVPNLLPMGLVILAGGPKLGKSWLILAVCLAVGRGGHVLGYFQAESCKVLILALEDSNKRLQDRIKALCQKEPELAEGLSNVDFQTSWPRFDDEGGLEKLEEYIKINVPNGLKLVVIDTLAKVGPKAKSKGLNAYENDSLIMGRIKSLADKYSVCILLITHLNKLKPSKDPFDAITGSMGQFGTADTALLLARTRGAETAKLMTTGRDIDGETYGLRWIKPGWTCTGIDDGASESLTPERQEILQAFKDANGPLSPAMVAHTTGKTPKNTSKHIKKLEEEGFLFSVGYGLYSLNSGGSGGSNRCGGSGGSGYSSTTSTGSLRRTENVETESANPAEVAI